MRSMRKYFCHLFEFVHALLQTLKMCHLKMLLEGIGCFSMCINITMFFSCIENIFIFAKMNERFIQTIFNQEATSFVHLPGNKQINF